MILLGIGFTLAFSSLNIQATAGIADDEQGLAGGLLNTSLQAGGAIGLAVVTAVLTANGGREASPAALLTGLTPALSVVTGIRGAGPSRSRSAAWRPVAAPRPRSPSRNWRRSQTDPGALWPCANSARGTHRTLHW